MVSKIVLLLLQWFGQNGRDLPWRRTRDPYAIWVSEIMLQQTQVKTVIPYWERWMRALPTVQMLAKARSGKLHKLWEGLGYYARVRNLQRAAKIICERYNGRFPSRFEDVLSLPGIGRYTAGAICSIAFGQPAPVLDGNVIRVLSRLFCIEGDPHNKAVNSRLWQIAGEMVLAASTAVQWPPKSSPGTRRIWRVSFFNQALMELGALVCTPKGAQCGRCPLSERCLARRRGRVEQFPQLPSRVRATARRILAFVIEKEGRVLVRQRPAGVINAHLWEFPNVEVTNHATGLIDAARSLPVAKLGRFKPLCVIKHSITRYRITMEVFAGALNGQRLDAPGERWVSRRELSRLPFASAHKKVLSQLPGVSF